MCPCLVVESTKFSMQSPQTVVRKFKDELILYKMAETDCEKESNWKRKLISNMRIFHVSVNSDPEFAWQFCTLSTQN
jgi:hypothetical protein